MARHGRTGTEADLDGLWEVFRIRPAPESRREEWLADLDPSRCLVVDGPHGEVAAASHIRPFTQWFSGRPVHGQVLLAGGRAARVPHGPRLAGGPSPPAGPRTSASGEVISALFPAALSLYRAVGFEVAGSYVHRRFPAVQVSTIRPERPVDVRRGGVAGVEAVHRCHSAAAPGRGRHREP